MIIKIDQFEGPMSLLLKMIQEEKLDITEVSLLKITDQYIEYIKISPDINPDNIADFLVIASKLLLIKSRTMLPYLSQVEEEEIQEFEEQLKMYQEFLQAAKNIESMISKKRFMFAREFDSKAIVSNSFPDKVNIKEWPIVFKEIISRMQPIEFLEESLIQDNISIEDRIDYIKNMVADKLKFVFANIIEKANSKTEVIVSFLAILELLKQRDIIIEQTELFGEIKINKI
ncbi:MAG: segregation/condensation protein A [bacterium]